MNVDKSDTAIVLIDPQNEVLSEKGLAWGAVGASVTENRTVENIERILKAAKVNGYEVFISPHYYYPTDDGWTLWDPFEAVGHQGKMFARSGPLSVDGFVGSGADWLARFKPYIEDGETVIGSPIECLAQRRTTSFYNYASAGSAPSSSAGCWQTSASSLTCVSSWSRASKSWS
jgi:nicotinamidase-related amidase